MSSDELLEEVSNSLQYSFHFLSNFQKTGDFSTRMVLFNKSTTLEKSYNRLISLLFTLMKEVSPFWVAFDQFNWCFCGNRILWLMLWISSHQVKTKAARKPLKSF